jgi:hypothetical protein
MPISTIMSIGTSYVNTTMVLCFYYVNVLKLPQETYRTITFLPYQNLMVLFLSISDNTHYMKQS